MRKAIFSLIALLALAGGATMIVENDAKADLKVVGKIPVLGMKDLEGAPLLFGDARLKGERIVFCFLATWSYPSVEQAKEVLATFKASRQAKTFDGTLVMVCDGADIDSSFIGSRRLRQEIDPNWQEDGTIWVTPMHSEKVDLGSSKGSLTTLEDKFKEAFPDLGKLDRIPAIVISDKEGRVSYGSHGRITLETIRAQLGFN